MDEVAFKTHEIWSVMTHAVAIPAIYLAFAKRRQTGVLGFLLLAMIWNSTLYHACLYANDQLCLLPARTHQLLDHITAEGTIVVVSILFLRIDDLNLQDLAMLFSVWTLGWLKVIDDTLLYIAVFLAVIGSMSLWRSREIFTRRDVWLLVLIFVGSVISFSLYFLTEWEEYTHPLWHFFVFSVLFPVIYVATAKEVDKK